MDHQVWRLAGCGPLQARELCWPLSIREQMLLETLSISQHVWYQGWNAGVELARMVLQGGRRWRRAGGSLLCLPDPLSNQKVCGGFGTPAVGIRKGGKKSPLGEKGMRWDTGDRRVSTPPYQQISIPSSSPCGQISICGSNDPASGPCGQSRSKASDKDEVGCGSHGAF